MITTSPPPRTSSSPPPTDAPPSYLPQDLYDNLHFDDQQLTTLEKIYLFSRSNRLVHRVFISRSLHTFLPDVSPVDAVEYVLPLLNGLATDQVSVKEALVTNLVHIMWWFFENCHLIDHEPSEEPHDPPLLSVQTFTPILGSLLIDRSNLVSGSARLVVVESLNRLRAAQDKGEDHPNFGPAKWKMLEHEIIHHVIIGMGRLDTEYPQGDLSSPPRSMSPRSDPTLVAPVPTLSPGNFSSLPSNSDRAAGDALAAELQENHRSSNVQGQDDLSEQAAIGRCSSMSLIATVTANATLPEETTATFTHEVTRICEDPLYWVRREASFALGALAKVVPAELLELSILPLFSTLTRDTTWHVRHSATFALPGILARLAPPQRRTLALETLLLMTEDVSPTVRSGVLEVLGEVIYTFHADEGGVPVELVELFVGKGKGEKGTTALEDDSAPTDPAKESDAEASRGLIASFNYPAVVLSLGPRRWPEIREYYLALAYSPHVRVRRTIASSLGEIARILGEEISRQDLLTVWEMLVHDGEDGDTRLRALRGVEMLVRALEMDDRRRVVGELGDLWGGWLEGWRERECVARQLGGLAGVATAGQEDVVRGLLGKALVDGVAAVREAGINAVDPTLRAFENKPHVVDGIRDDLQSLARAETCRRRATYVACYHALVESERGEVEIARDEFWENITLLSRDIIVDVRIGVARLLSVICEKIYTDPEKRPAGLHQALRRVGRDASPDVRAFVECLDLRVPRPPVTEVPRAPVLYATFSRPPPSSGRPRSVTVEHEGNLRTEEGVSNWEPS